MNAHVNNLQEYSVPISDLYSKASEFFGKSEEGDKHPFFREFNADNIKIRGSGDTTYLRFPIGSRQDAASFLTYLQQGHLPVKLSYDDSSKTYGIAFPVRKKIEIPTAEARETPPVAPVPETASPTASPAPQSDTSSDLLAFSQAIRTAVNKTVPGLEIPNDAFFIAAETLQDGTREEKIFVKIGDEWAARAVNEAMRYAFRNSGFKKPQEILGRWREEKEGVKANYHLTFDLSEFRTELKTGDAQDTIHRLTYIVNNTNLTMGVAACVGLLSACLQADSIRLGDASFSYEIGPENREFRIYVQGDAVGGHVARTLKQALNMEDSQTIRLVGADADEPAYVAISLGKIGKELDGLKGKLLQTLQNKQQHVL